MIEIIPNWHPIFVHFTVALITVAALGFLVAQLFVKKAWSLSLRNASLLNLWLGAVVTLGTLAAGFYAYNTVAHDTPSHLAMTEHRNWALATAGFIVIFAVSATLVVRRVNSIVWPVVIFGLVTSGMVIATAWRGGELVYRYGLGVMSLPNAGSHAHPGNEQQENNETFLHSYEKKFDKDHHQNPDQMHTGEKTGTESHHHDDSDSQHDDNHQHEK